MENTNTSACMKSFTSARKMSVAFNESINTYHDVTAYSRVYVFLPSTMVSAMHGWK